jgi:hypothetical protein
MRRIFLTLCLISSAVVAHPGGHERDKEELVRMRNTDSERLEQQKLPRVEKSVASNVSDEVPQKLMDKVRADLTVRVNNAAIELSSAKYVTWSDGALGCPKPGMMYTQALVSGYQLIFSADGKPWDYRISDNGMLVLCKQPVLNIEQRNPAR